MIEPSRLLPAGNANHYAEPTTLVTAMNDRTNSDDTHDPAAAAARMVQTQLHRRGIVDQRVLEAMTSVPRHHFVPEVDIEAAYSDRALPTAEGQTISQPYIVAKMTEMLQPQPDSRVLEVGTGSGYQTAVLALLAKEIVTIERFAGLAERAREAIASLGLAGKITFVVGDGTLGHPPKAPYDGILVTAAAPTVPAALRDQLAEGGRLVLPLGEREGQHLYVIRREGEHFTQTQDLSCRFVPLVGEQGWDHDHKDEQ